MASKAFLTSLKKGQILHAQVEDISSVTGILLNFQGDLLRISNLTGQMISKGQSIRLQVMSLEPLQFQVFNSHSTRFQRVV
ncbi:hypothetical protein [Bdellovibrio svalbardensis]|uniref:Uncharacterized protein n=1 Tax=Bdellovibrio svalbardensis TaxID=2972972 RepID=A0ABT6DJB9_9BACT|nr:hypothetical protein [Bdellovibrio svalbardensis]MDG0816930.1 hypothetical protein [Bdellovibrio svalbardensis]